MAATCSRSALISVYLRLKHRLWIGFEKYCLEGPSKILSKCLIGSFRSSILESTYWAIKVKSMIVNYASNYLSSPTNYSTDLWITSYRSEVVGNFAFKAFLKMFQRWLAMSINFRVIFGFRRQRLVANRDSSRPSSQLSYDIKVVSGDFRSKWRGCVENFSTP